MRIGQQHILAGNPRTAVKTLRELSFHADPAVRRRVAENNNAPADVLRKLFQDSNPEVRAALAFNPSVPETMLKALCKDEDVNVRLALADGLALPDAVLKLLAEDENPYVRERAETTLEIKALEQNLKAEDFTAERGDDGKLGDLLCKSGRLDERRLIRLLRVATNERRPLGHVLLRETDLPQEVIISALKVQSRIRRGTMSLADGIAMLRRVQPDNAATSRMAVSSKTLPFTIDDLSETRKLDWSEWRLRQAAQYSIAKVLDDSSSLSDAAPELLRTICETASLDVGVIWRVSPDRSRLVMVDLWHVPSRPVPTFDLMSRSAQFEPGTGLPGRVWESGGCAWISDLMSDGNFPGYPSAQVDGLVSGFAIPFKIQGNVTGVLEFFSRTRREPDAAMLEFFYSVGSQIGQFIERKEAQSRLREFQAITTAIGDALVQSATLSELLQGCAEAMVTYLNATFARIWTLDQSEQYLLLQASAGLYKHIDGLHSRIKVGQFKVGLIASEQVPHLTNDVQSDPRVSDKEWAKKEGIVAFAGHPLMVEGKLVGVMGMFAREPLTQETVSALSSIADQIALGIQRKNNEEAHRKLASIVESSDDGIISMDLEGTICHWNSGAERMYGYAADEIIDQPISLLENNEKPTGLLQKCGEVELGVHLDPFETALKRTDGTFLPVSMTLSPIKDSSGKLTGVAAITRDISQRKRHESLLAAQYEVTDALSKALSLNEAVPKMLESMARCMNCQWGALWIFDDVKANLRCVDGWSSNNDRLSEFAMISKYMTFPAGTGLIGRAYSEGRILWDAKFSTKDCYPRARIAFKTGMHSAVAFPVAIEGKVLAVIEFFNSHIDDPDVDLLNMISSVCTQLAQFIERKNAEHKTQKALLAEQMIAQAIIDRAPAGIARLDANLVITSTNSQFAQLFGEQELTGSVRQLLGRFIFQVLPEVPTEKLIETVRNRLPFHLNEYLVKSNQDRGEPIRVWDLAGWPVETEEGGMILMATEVTDRVKLAEQRDDFVATLTHDLKNPLIGAIRVLGCFTNGQVGALDEMQVSILKELASSHESMLRLISNLLEVYRHDGGHAELECGPVDLKQLSESTIQELSIADKDLGVHLESIFLETDNLVPGDSTALRRVLTNLVSNGIKFTGQGGSVTVSGRKLENSYYYLEVKDTGPGISEQEQERLFQRFSQGGLGRQNQSGTGLGLYLSRQIVERHGGTIICESELGQGTTFKIYLPKGSTLPRSE